MTAFFRKKSIVKKLIIPYMIVLALPILIIWVYLFPQLQQRMIDNALAHQANNSARLSTILDQHLSSMVSSTIGFAANPQLTAYSIKSNALGNYQAVKEIKKYPLANSFVSQSFYYLKQNNRFYTSSAAYPLSWLNNTDYGYCYYDWPAQQMYADLQTLNTLTVRPLERVAYPDHMESQVVTILLPVPMNSKTPYAVLMLWVDQAALESLVAPIGQSINECTLIYDNAGNRIFSMYEEQIDLSARELDAAVKLSKPNGTEWIRLAGKSYIYTATGQGSNKWQCVSLMPLDTLMKDIHAMRLNLILINLLLLVASAFIIAAAVRSHYQPIRTLASKAEQYVAGHGGNNEFEVVHHALDHLNTKAAQLQSRFLDTIPLLKEHRLYALIGGQYETIDAFNQAAKETSVRLTLPFLSVALIRTDAKESFDVLEYLENLEAGLPSGLEGYYLPAFNRKDILFVSASQSPQAAAVYISDIYDDLGATHRCRVQAAVGHGVREAGELALSYSGATNRLEKMTLMGNYGVECCGAESQMQNIAVIAKLYPMDFAVAKLDADQIRKSVEDVLAFFHDEASSPMMIQAIYLNALTSLLRGLENLEVETRPFHPLLEISQGVKYEEMAYNLHHLSGMLCDCIEKSPQGTEVDIEDVKSFIQANCLHYDFTVQCVAEHFRMSYTGFSHYFKRRVGVACKQFVDEYRAEKAIELIMNTLESLEVIAPKVGFANAASFIRSFKKVTGRTPGSYRKL